MNRGIVKTATGIPNHMHGRLGTYNYLKCRCVKCRAASAAYQNERRQAMRLSDEQSKGIK